MKKELFNELGSIMKSEGLDKYTVEILLQNKKDKTVAAYTICMHEHSYDKRPVYIGDFQSMNYVNSDNPCVWLASLLALDFEILYCSLSFHCLLWSIYYDCFDSIDLYENGLTDYLRYCKQQHITPELLENYCGGDFDDIPSMEFIEMIHEQTVIERFTMNDQAFVFAVDELKGTFGVYDSDSNYSCYKNEKIYTSYLEAFNDFQGRIKKHWYDKLRAFHKDCFFIYGADKEIDDIIHNQRNPI